MSQTSKMQALAAVGCFPSCPPSMLVLDCQPWYIGIMVCSVGPFLVTKHFLPLFMKKKTRVIVNSSSVCGSISATVKGGIGGENPLASVLLPYNTSKAALNMRKQAPLNVPCLPLFVHASKCALQKVPPMHSHNATVAYVEQSCDTSKAAINILVQRLCSCRSCHMLKCCCSSMLQSRVCITSHFRPCSLSICALFPSTCNSETACASLSAAWTVCIRGSTPQQRNPLPTMLCPPHYVCYVKSTALSLPHRVYYDEKFATSSAWSSTLCSCTGRKLVCLMLN